MIQLLSEKYSKHIACILSVIFLCGLMPVFGRGSMRRFSTTYYPAYNKTWSNRPSNGNNKFAAPREAKPAVKAVVAKNELPVKNAAAMNKPAKPDIGGPSQPEMTSFKSVGTDNMVNLFTGDFSYNIPLLDVGGYPVNLFYDGGISMEQEASWVGLGWNINPGTVSRNMRGVPDDFNGEDIMTQRQEMKPNKTWGININPDLELVGVKDIFGLGINVSIGSLGVSFNNYLGPALDLGIKGGTNFTIASKSGSEKSSASLNLGVSVGANISSRNGLTLSPNVSLTGTSFANDKKFNAGVGLSTSYNSRTGIKQLQISEQMSVNYYAQKKVGTDEKGKGIYKNGVASSMGATLYSGSISFSKPSYVPSLRMPLDNEAYSGHFQVGGGIFGVYGSLEAEVYKQTSKTAKIIQTKPLVGFLYAEKAKNNPNAVMDFTRLNDNEVTPKTPIISAPQYAYDVFSIQGEGTGGSIRAYRNELGYVRDNSTRSSDNSLSIGGDIGIPGHFGANFNTIKTPTVIREWGFGNKLPQVIGFRSAKDTIESVYFRNPGETSVLITDQFKKMGGTDLVRFKLGGTDAMPTIEPVLERFSKSNILTGTTSLLQPDITQRRKRTQVVTFLNAFDASVIGLDKKIRSYNTSSILDGNNNLKYDSTDRVDADGAIRKKHHISEIRVTEISGRRYVYGLPVYSKVQRDYTFSVNKTGTADDVVDITETEPTTLNNAQGKDGYVQVTETPAYAHSFLLTGLLSSDYVDVTNNGITEDDMGDAVKFNYSRYNDHKWRTPHNTGTTANFNDGHLSDRKDDKGVIAYGVRESWYLHSIESKTMIALFTLEGRTDGKGPVSEYKGVDINDNSLKRLQKIDLYNKADLKKNGLTNAKPVKTVWFTYSYSLCTGTPDNKDGGGKLTLDGVYFTFNGKNRNTKDKYVFDYDNAGAGNPGYAPNASDRWGSYKTKAQNPEGMKNRDYPYALQNKTVSDQNAAAWSLKKILLPSGGQIEVEYESDDYAFVQNRRACDMMQIAGLGADAATITSNLYGVSPTLATSGFVDFDYVFIKVPEPCANRTEVYQKYLQGISQLVFKLSVNMPKGIEYVNSYATIADYGKYDATRIWVRLNKANGLSPLTLSCLEYLREQLPGQAYPGYDVSESGGLKAVGEMLLGMLDGLKSAFKDQVKYLRSQGRVQTINPANSFVRLNDPDGFKYGGGQRVKTVRLKDNWKPMTANQQYTSEYGQEYSYTTTEVFNGVKRSISSGVASYEPSIGGEENPFQTIVQVTNKLPLGPASYGAIEMPVLDAFFPAPVVGYSKVTVKSLNKNTPTKKSRSGIGKQVHEFYTAKDFPVYYNHTSIDPASDKQEHQASVLNFFYKYAFDSRALSQGFIVETNDMHGKLKSESSYAENDSLTRIYYTQNFYRNTGSKGLEEKFDFADRAFSGAVYQGNMGIDVELMTDTREFSVKSTSLEVQAQVDLFPVLLPFWLPFIWPVAGESENTYRAVTTTKVINYHAILDSVVVIDKGSQVSTKNMVYDSETGDVLVTRTNNEFDKPVYSVKYPAWWAYSGMGLAYKNIDAVYTDIDFNDGKMIGAAFEQAVIESGDELYIFKSGSGTSNCIPASDASVKRLWAFDKNKSSTALTVPVKDLVYLDEKGKLFTQNDVSFRIVRSGKRNTLEAPVASITLMSNPVDETTHKLNINSSSDVIDATAAEYQEKWQADNEVVRKYSLFFNANTCTYDELEDCNGYLEKSINPYLKGLVGNFRPYRNRLFYGERKESNPLASTDLPKNGFLLNFQLFWDFNSYNNLVPNTSNTQWVWQNQMTRFNTKGMELENKNVMNIYTAALFGYHKTLPTAVATNSRYDEMAYEGFEDYEYAEALNPASVNSCTKKHITLTNLNNSQIVSSDVTGFAAHTGKYMMAVPQGATVTQTLPVSAAPAEDYSFAFTKDTVQQLDQIGGNAQLLAINPGFAGQSDQNAYFQPRTTFTSGGMQSVLSMGNNSVTNGGSRTFSHSLRFTTNYYINVAQYGSYQFIISIDGNSYNLPPEDYSTAHFEVLGEEGNTVYSQFFSNYAAMYQILNVTLCKGIHLIRITFSNDFSYTTTNLQQTYVSTAYIFKLTTNAAGTNYKNLSKVNSCIYTKPMAATDAMLNPIFSIPANKKMLFSAWVHEACTTCAATGFVHNQINIGSTVLKPTGPIIDGWQRYEGEIPPAAAGEMTLNFVNNSGSTIYFDDIRIHPYNANMKSYVYDPVNQKLVAELDANNYASFYEYDEEGSLIRTKVETREGIKTINETRSFKQKSIEVMQ
ncbi:hypothetical protein FAM09_29605 [Niastella caeni]|uniref:PA14 domain-containing protein n=1 Tax=Niastella caeni TaxID=2569763 RepID=A0A4S8H7E2_9BACT|nr:hypothetical protein [Niastella caeni]THU30758.1 hypothetical protein FAM09_29605 [Niastella caeni]